MKLIALLATLLSFSSAFAYTSVSGDKIHFQSESTYVSAVFSKSLCLDGDTYEAVINKCVEWTNNDERRCVRNIKITAYQPMKSTRQRCAEFGGGDDKDCTRWETVAYVQSPVRTVKFLDEDDRVIKTQKVTVPACN